MKGFGTPAGREPPANQCRPHRGKQASSSLAHVAFESRSVDRMSRS